MGIDYTSGNRHFFNEIHEETINGVVHTSFAVGSRAPYGKALLKDLLEEYARDGYNMRAMFFSEVGNYCHVFDSWRVLKELIEAHYVGSNFNVTVCKTNDEASEWDDTEDSEDTVIYNEDSELDQVQLFPLDH